MVKTGQFGRLLILTALLGACFAGLAGRLVVLQYFSHEKYRALATMNTERTYVRHARRGDILDREGNPLATSIPVKKVFADPSLIREHYYETAQVLAPLLNYGTEELAKLLQPVVRCNEKGVRTTNQYVNLHRKVSAEHWDKIAQTIAQTSFHAVNHTLTSVERQFYAAFRRYAIYAEEDQHRIYPSRALASHVLGFVQEAEEGFNSSSMSAMQGRDGIEAWFDEKLRGLPGWRVTGADVRRREIVVRREEEVEPRPGLNVVLTIDMVIQKAVEDELAVAMKDNDPASAAAVVVRPATGEILAMATLPNYDPNRPGESLLAHRRNRIISDQMEPGSTFKIVAVASALNEKVVAFHDTFDCEHGRWIFMGRPLKDHQGYGVLSVEEILIKSSNIGTAKIGIRLGEERLYEHILAFGFGTRSGITLGGEASGTVHPPRKWDKLMISRIPMGQAVAVTHLQMVMAMSAIANGGRLMRPMLIQRLQQQNGEVFAEYHPQMVRQVVSEPTAEQVVAALKRVVSSEGTAEKAQLAHYTVAGKTGTAEKPGKGGYLEGKYIASFMGFFPADAPEVCISVVLDEPRRGYYGGQKAAPVFQRIAQQVAQHLKIKPDRDDLPSDATTGVRSNRTMNTALVRP